MRNRLCPDPFMGPMPRFESDNRLTPAEGLERFRRAQRERDRDRIRVGNLIASSPGWSESELRRQLATGRRG